MIGKLRILDEDSAIVMLGYAPDDIFKIQDIVKARNSFVALVEGDLYEVVHYLDPRSPFKFTGYLDRNVYSRMAALAQARTFPENALADLRWAAAILAFCQIADVTFDYASSIYELASSQGGGRADEEIKAFRIVDNSSTQLIIDFATGKSSGIPKGAMAVIEEPNTFPPDTFVRRTNEFRLNYIFVLKIAALARQQIDGLQKMMLLLEWMHDGFMFGSPALHFANRYFSPTRFRRMLKGFSRQEIRNAAWDLTFIQMWRRNALKGLQANRPALLISGDTALKDIAGRMTAETQEEFERQLQEVWGKGSSAGREVFNKYCALWDAAQRDPNRRDKVPDYNAQLRMIEEMENTVFV